MDVFLNILGNYAFPIVACVYLALENREQRKVHREETAKLSQVLEANTLALTRLTDKLEAGYEYIEDRNRSH